MVGWKKQKNWSRIVWRDKGTLSVQTFIYIYKYEKEPKQNVLKTKLFMLPSKLSHNKNKEKCWQSKEKTFYLRVSVFLEIAMWNRYLSLGEMRKGDICFVACLVDSWCGWFYSPAHTGMSYDIIISLFLQKVKIFPIYFVFKCSWY